MRPVLWRRERTAGESDFRIEIERLQGHSLLYVSRRRRIQNIILSGADRTLQHFERGRGGSHRSEKIGHDLFAFQARSEPMPQQAAGS